MFADPGLNLASGEGFTTRWWWHQREGELFVSNSPLYPLLVGGWSQLVGSSVVPLRTLNYLLLLAAGGVLALVVQRIKPQVGPLPVLLMVFALWTGYGMTFSYRSIRYDMLGLLLVALAALALTLPQKRVRHGMLVLIGLCLPLAGLHLLPYVAGLGVLLLILDRSQFFNVFALGGGAAIGLLGFAGYVYQLGLFEQFYESVIGLSDHGKSMTDRLRIAGGAVLIDPSSLFLLGGILGVSLLPAARPYITWQLVGYTVFAGVLIPAIVSLAGKFPIYYAWMKYVPLCVVLCILLDRLLAARQRLPAALLVVTALAASYGLAGRMYLSAQYWDSNRSEHLHVFAEGVVVPGDRVVATPIAYFAARSQTPAVYSAPNASRLGSDERQELTLLLIAPSEAQSTIRDAGGQWKLVAQFRPQGVAVPPESTDPSHVYHVVNAYRRTPIDG